MLAELCLEMRDHGPEFAARTRAIPSETVRAAGPACPSSLEAAGFIARKIAKSARLRWHARSNRDAKWFVAIRPNRGESVDDAGLSGFHEIALPGGIQMMADPFLCEFEERSFVLFEEVAAGQSRGRIACTRIAPDGSCEEHAIVLERPYHVSYPCVVPHAGDLFLMPESADASRVDLYRFTRFPSQVELVATPIE